MTTARTARSIAAPTACSTRPSCAEYPRLVGELAAATAATARNRVGRLAGTIAGLAARSGPDVRTAAEVSPNHG